MFGRTLFMALVFAASFLCAPLVVQYIDLLNDTLHKAGGVHKQVFYLWRCMPLVCTGKWGASECSTGITTECPKA